MPPLFSAGRPVVLLVDDEPEILVALQDLLEDEFTVLTAGSGEEAVALLRDRRDVAVIVSDQRMRGMTGDEFLARAHEFCDAAGILLTGYTDLDTVISVLNRGEIMFYASKPWQPDALRSMVRQAAAGFRLRRDLGAERKLLSGLLDNLPAGLAFKDAQGRFIRLNALAASAFGRKVEDCLGRTEEELASPDRLAALKEVERELHRLGRASETVRRPDETGSATWRRITRAMLPAADGAPRMRGLHEGVSVLIDQDVNDLMDLEQRLRQTEKMQAIGTLAGGIAHDFNNMLTTILGSLELVEDLSPIRDPQVSRLLANATEAARRGAAITRRLLDFSRPRDADMQPVDVPALLTHLHGLLIQNISAHSDGASADRSWTIRMIPAGMDLMPAMTDPAQLELALIGLCMNARDAQPEGGEIMISVVPETVGARQEADGLAPGNYVVIRVSDKGAGMSPETQARIFEPFFTTKGVGRATGLGLSTTYGFVRRNGGDVRVTSAPGAGATVELWLPASKEPLLIKEVARQVDAPGHIAARDNLHVLVVDDEPSVGAVTAGFLRHAGLQVTQCDGGAAALAVLATGVQIGLVVLDLLMPDMGGDECARRIRATQPDMPILFVTGFADRSALPPDAVVLDKPFSRAALLAAVGEVRTA